MTTRRSKRIKKSSLSSEFVYDLKQSLGKRSGSFGYGVCGSTENAEVSSCQLSDLPGEIIVQILNFLPLRDLCAASSVCKSWNGLCKNPALWKTVSFEGLAGRQIQGRRLWKQLDKAGTSGLVFKDSLMGYHLVERAIPYFRKRKNITALFINSITKGDLDILLVDMPQLKVLKVAYLMTSMTTSAVCIYFDWNNLGYLPQLEELTLSSCYSMCRPTISFSSGKRTLADLRNLKKLVLTNFDCITDDQLAFLEQLNQLESLELGNFDNTCTFDTLAIKGLEQLKSLGLIQAHCRCQRYTCHCLIPALQNLKRLEKLSLIMCMVPEDLNRALRAMKHIKVMEIWPYLDRFYPARYKHKDFHVENVAETYAEMFMGLTHLRRVTVGLLDNCFRGFKTPFCCLSEAEDDDDDDGDSSASDEVVFSEDNDGDGVDLSNEVVEEDGSDLSNEDEEDNSEDNGDLEDWDQNDRFGRSRAEEIVVQKKREESEFSSDHSACDEDVECDEREKNGNRQQLQIKGGERIHRIEIHHGKQETISKVNRSNDCTEDDMGDHQMNDLNLIYTKSSCLFSNTSVDCPSNDQVATIPNLQDVRSRGGEPSSAIGMDHRESTLNNVPGMLASHNLFPDSGDATGKETCEGVNSKDETDVEFFDMVMEKLMFTLPSTRVTLYEVVVRDIGSDDNSMEMNYISRVEEHYTTLDI